jgi:hypothetical protein
VDHLHATVVLRGERVGDRAGAVGRGVIHDDHADVHGQGKQPLHERRQILFLVVGGYDDTGCHRIL